MDRGRLSTSAVPAGWRANPSAERWRRATDIARRPAVPGRRVSATPTTSIRGLLTAAAPPSSGCCCSATSITAWCMRAAGGWSSATAGASTSPLPGTDRPTKSGQPFGQAIPQPGHRYPLLLHRVALADRHRLVLQGVEVDRHAEGGADLVLAPVAAADVAAGLVVLDAEPALAQRGLDLVRHLDQALLL